MGLLEAHLPARHGGADGFLWRWAADGWLPCAARLESCLSGPRAPTDGVRILKDNGSRMVFRLWTPEGAPGLPPTVIVKTWRFDDMTRRLVRWRRYGPEEATNLIEAGVRNLPVPRVYGYGMVRRWCSVRRTLIVMEDFADCVPVADLLAEAGQDRERLAAVLDGVGTLLVRLFRVGANHIDLRPHNVLARADSLDAMRLVDLRFMRYHPQPRLHVLLSQLGWFTAWVKDDIPRDVLDAWVRRVLAKANVDASPSVLETYAGYCRFDLSRQERLDIS